jgi:SET domain-containing protein
MKTLPHEGVYVRLKPSAVHGVGVFAIRDILKGTYVFRQDDQRIIWIAKQDIKQIPKAVRELYEDFCIIKGGRYGCPKSFDTLTPAWYLNHSENPNVAADSNTRFYALRNIRKGEELTVDYRAYSEMPKKMLPRRRVRHR